MLYTVLMSAGEHAFSYLLSFGEKLTKKAAYIFRLVGCCFTLRSSGPSPCSLGLFSLRIVDVVVFTFLKPRCFLDGGTVLPMGVKLKKGAITKK